jgi:hypothetical protein
MADDCGNHEHQKVRGFRLDEGDEGAGKTGPSSIGEQPGELSSDRTSNSDASDAEDSDVDSSEGNEHLAEPAPVEEADAEALAVENRQRQLIGKERYARHSASKQPGPPTDIAPIDGAGTVVQGRVPRQKLNVGKLSMEQIEKLR